MRCVCLVHRQSLPVQFVVVQTTFLVDISVAHVDNKVMIVLGADVVEHPETHRCVTIAIAIRMQAKITSASHVTKLAIIAHVTVLHILVQHLLHEYVAIVIATAMPVAITSATYVTKLEIIVHATVLQHQM